LSSKKKIEIIGARFPEKTLDSKRMIKYFVFAGSGAIVDYEPGQMWKQAALSGNHDVSPLARS